MMTYFQRRAWCDPSDMFKMQHALAQWASINDSLGYIHPGDLAHRLGNGMRGQYDYADLVEIWEDDSGDVQGFVIIFPRWNYFEVAVHPDFKGSEFEEELLGRAVSQTRDWIDRLQPEDRSINVDYFEGDESRLRLIEERGFVMKNPQFAYTTRSLHEPIPVPQLPDGFSIRNIYGVGEAEKLAKVHSGAFGSGWTAETYAKVMESPGYDSENEFVVIAPGGDFAAFTVTWRDSINRTGLFEPVGTHKDYWRKGLASALMNDVMRRMRNDGLETAIVWHGLDNPASSALYASLGFKRKYRVFEYVLRR